MKKMLWIYRDNYKESRYFYMFREPTPSVLNPNLWAASPAPYHLPCCDVIEVVTAEKMHVKPGCAKGFEVIETPATKDHGGTVKYKLLWEIEHK